MLKARCGKNYLGLFDFCNYIKNLGNIKEMTILEIGTFAGESASVFAQFFKEVTCIDSWIVENLEKNSPMRACIQEAEKVFDDLVKKQTNIIKIKGNSLDVEKTIGKNFDVIYIDGEHSYNNVKADIEAWLPHARVFISGHDYRRNVNEDVIRAVNETFGKPNITFQDWSWIVRIK